MANNKKEKVAREQIQKRSHHDNSKVHRDDIAKTINKLVEKNPQLIAKIISEWVKESEKG